jgi:hypothetical protein
MNITPTHPEFPQIADLFPRREEKRLSVRCHTIRRADWIVAHAKALRDKNLSAQLHSLLTAIARAQIDPRQGYGRVSNLAGLLGISYQAVDRHCRLSPNLIADDGKRRLTLTQEAILLLYEIESMTKRNLPSKP